MRLRAYLALLALGAIAPVAVFALVVSSFILEHDRATYQRAAQERARAIMTAVDAEVGGSIATARALGASLDLGNDDFAAFREVADRILRTQPNWSNISLALPSGQQVVNLQRPQGAPLHSIAGIDDSLERIRRTRMPVVNDLGYGTVTQKWDIAVRVPVLRDGDIKYILSVIVKPESLREVLLAQGLPGDWVASVVDGNGRFVARTQGGDALVGQPASESLREKIRASRGGWAEGKTVEGREVFTAHQRSELTGWTIAMGIPKELAGAGAERVAWLLALGLTAAVAFAVILARIIGRRVTRPIDALASATAAIGRGDVAAMPPSGGVTEIDSLATTMKAAAIAIGERQQLIERERAALQEADRAKDEFIAMLSHELRNPLAALTAAAHLLKVGGPRGDAADHVQGVVERQTHHMTRLVEDLLDVSRVTMGKATLERENFDLSRAVNGVLATWRTSGRLERHKILLDASSVWVNGDRARIEQILSNLLDNALKFTPAGKSIRIALRQEGGEAVLQVADSGEGLSPELAARVFGLFVQGQSSLDRSRGGMGIGLALVKRLVEMHGGSVGASSEGQGRGATFTVRLPAIAAAATPRRRLAWKAPAGALRILVVEDNEDARRMLGAALAHDGHEVIEAPDGRTAIDAATKTQPHVALIDIGLPDLNGYEVARCLRSTDSGQRIALIAVTGYGQAKDRQLALDAGFDEHLTKPVEPELLIRAVGALAGSASAG